MKKELNQKPEGLKRPPPPPAPPPIRYVNEDNKSCDINRKYRKPIAWRIVQPSGNVAFVENDIMESLVRSERPCLPLSLDLVREVYRVTDVTALYDT